MHLVAEIIFIFLIVYLTGSSSFILPAHFLINLISLNIFVSSDGIASINASARRYFIFSLLFSACFILCTSLLPLLHLMSYGIISR